MKRLIITCLCLVILSGCKVRTDPAPETPQMPAETINDQGSQEYSHDVERRLQVEIDRLRAQQIKTPEKTVPAPTPKPAPSSSALDKKRDKVVKTALDLQNKVQYVHWKLRQEQTPPYKTDCSGYTYLTYRLANVGVKLINRDDDDQSHVGKLVTWGNWKKGDLLFFWTDPNDRGNIGHVGIYIGDGKMIHNANSSKDVIISKLNTDYYTKRYIIGRRVIL